MVSLYYSEYLAPLQLYQGVGIYIFTPRPELGKAATVVTGEPNGMCYCNKCRSISARCAKRSTPALNSDGSQDAQGLDNCFTTSLTTLKSSIPRS